MGRISEFTLDILDSLSGLGVSVRKTTSDLPEEDDGICLQSCISFSIDLHSESETSSGRPIQSVLKADREQNEKSLWISSRPLTSKSNAIFSLWLLQVLVAFAMIVDIRANIIESPVNQVSKASTQAIMKCKTDRTDKRLLWVGVDQASKPVSVYDGDTVNPAYQAICSVNPTAGRYDLQVKEPQQLALMLKCIEPGAENIERTSELIVIESDPTCAVERGNATSTESVDLVCTMELSGNWIPTIRWRFNGIQKEITVVNKTERLDGQRVRLTSTLQGVPSKDKQKYMCDAFFTLESYQGGATARNVPAYMYTGFVSQDMPSSSLPPSTAAPSSQSQAGESTTHHTCDPDRYHVSFTVAMIFLFIAIGIIITLIVILLHFIHIITLPLLPKNDRDGVKCQCSQSKLPNGDHCPCLKWHELGLSLCDSRSQPNSDDTARSDYMKRNLSDFSEKDEAETLCLESTGNYGWKCQCLEWNKNNVPRRQGATDVKPADA